MLVPSLNTWANNFTANIPTSFWRIFFCSLLLDIVTKHLNLCDKCDHNLTIYGYDKKIFKTFLTRFDVEIQKINMFDVVKVKFTLFCVVPTRMDKVSPWGKENVIS